uniref:Uncharacterized protein n=1 Tax=Meloidogyne hapla TaxID=6305 RepID=A0A1I8BUE6_MELHA
MPNKYFKVFNYEEYLFIVIYIPFLILYRKRNSSQNAISTTNHWRRQLEVTATTLWLLLLYAFLWGGSYGALLYANQQQYKPKNV